MEFVELQPDLYIAPDKVIAIRRGKNEQTGEEAIVVYMTGGIAHTIPADGTVDTLELVNCLERALKK